MQSDSELKVFAKRLRSHNHRIRKYRCLVILIDLGLYFWGFKKTTKILNFFIKENNTPDITGDEAFLDNLVTIFNQIKENKLLKGKCLSQSLAMQFVLRRKAIDTNLIIGGNMRGGELFAHAWLERNESVINDHPFVVAKYKVLLKGNKVSNLNLK